MSAKRVAVIGAGPGGYVAAIRAAQLGADVTVVERGAVGGTCLNVGCIPTKAMLHAAELYAQARDGAAFGVVAKGVSLDWGALMERKRAVVDQLVAGVRALLSSNRVRLAEGEASFATPRELSVRRPDGATERVEADAVIVATGSAPLIPPVPGIDLEGVITSTEALSLKAPPKSIAVLGGGVIGLEFASLFSSLGASVAVVEMLPEILPTMDAEIAGILRGALARRGVVFHLSSRISEVARSGGDLVVRVETPSGPTALRAEKLLVAAGRRPVSEGLGLERIGVAVERGRIKVDSRMRTGVEEVYAVGDCASRIMLAHVASREGEVAAENIMGASVVMDYKTVPSVVYTSPEAASAGMSEEEARRSGLRARVGRFPMSANGRSLITNQGDGMVKYVVDERYGEIVGVHIVGPGASELVAQSCLALRLECTVDELITTIHAHPTVSEALREAAAATRGAAVNLPAQG